MSNVMASSDEQPSRAWELTNEIEKKLVQAKGICDALIRLIGDAQKAFKELDGLTKGKPVPCDAPPIA
jgi:hypothetical protein